MHPKRLPDPDSRRWGELYTDVAGGELPHVRLVRRIFVPRRALDDLRDLASDATGVAQTGVRAVVRPPALPGRSGPGRPVLDGHRTVGRPRRGGRPPMLGRPDGYM